jgi:hypothetical protein
LRVTLLDTNVGSEGWIEPRLNRETTSAMPYRFCASGGVALALTELHVLESKYSPVARNLAQRR